MKHYYIPHFILLFILLISGCQSGSTGSVADKPEKLKLNEVIKAFKEANLPLGQLEFYTAKSDPLKLLGKPNQYTEKATWQTTEKMVHGVEAFADEADLQARKTSIEAAAQSGAQPAEYLYVHKNILLRIHHEMIPRTARKFEQMLKLL
ncbi:MAG TPA: hypothetical protein VF692_06120 [Pyrinomonadaceae bacterium]|jgi:hypothetical protein